MPKKTGRPPLTAHDPWPVEPSEPKPEAVVERAYQIWATVGGRSPKNTEAILALEEGFTVRHATITGWIERHGWEERAEGEAQARSGKLRAQFTATSDVAAMEAMNYLLRVVRGTEDAPPGDRIRAARVVMEAAGMIGGRGAGPKLTVNVGGVREALTNDERARLSARLAAPLELVEVLGQVLDE